MPIYPVTRVRVSCDGCNAHLVMAGTSIFANGAEARRVITHQGWTIHPDGTVYCPDGKHP